VGPIGSTATIASLTT